MHFRYEVTVLAAELITSECKRNELTKKKCQDVLFEQLSR